MIEAFFLGPPKKRILASYHPPAGGYGEALTVICPPLFTEYMRTHVALRELANSLSEAGQHVLRFDYRGTGDSDGDTSDMAISDWLEDIWLAVEEGRSISGANQVNVVGVRASALLACRSVGALDELRRMVLWDPVSSGTEYVQAQRRMQAAMLERNIYVGRADWRDSENDFAGYRVSKEMEEVLGSLGEDIYKGVPTGKLHVVSTASSFVFAVPDAHRETVIFTCDWENDWEDLMMPQPVLERVLACLTMK